MYALGLTLYFSLSVAQAAAIVAGLEIWLGLSNVLAAPVGVLLGFVPLLGTMAAIAGAMDGWGWPFGPAAGAFVVPLLFGAIGLAYHLGARRSSGETSGAHPLRPVLNRTSSSR